MGGWVGCGGYVLGGWVAGESVIKAISASNLKLKLKLTELSLAKCEKKNIKMQEKTKINYV